MFQNVSLFIGLRYSRMAKGNAFISFISFFSISGIALGLIALITVVSVMNGFEQRLKSSMLSMTPDIELDVSDLDNNSYQQIQNALLKDPDVVSVNPHIKAEALVSSNQTINAVLMQGVSNTAQFDKLKHAINRGSWQALFDTRYSVLLSHTLAAQLDLRVGDKFRILVPAASSYTPLGRVPSQRLFTLVATFSHSEIEPNLVFSNTEFVSRMLKKPIEKVQTLAVKLNDPFLIDDVLERHTLFSKHGYSDWRQTQGSLFSAVAMEKKVMSLLLGLIIMVAIFNILSALAMMVSEKKSEIAILQTLGMTPNSILQIFMIQGLYNGVVGTLIGSVAGILIAKHINEILYFIGLQFLGGMQMPVLIEPIQITVILLLSLLMSFLATFYPAYKAASVNPAKVLRYE